LEDNIKIDLDETVCEGMGLDLFVSGYGPVADNCKRGNGHSTFTKGEEFDHSIDYQFLQKHFPPRNYCYQLRKLWTPVHLFIRRHNHNTIFMYSYIEGFLVNRSIPYQLLRVYSTRGLTVLRNLSVPVATRPET
jgi:hypothetical protein